MTRLQFLDLGRVQPDQLDDDDHGPHKKNPIEYARDMCYCVSHACRTLMK